MGMYKDQTYINILGNLIHKLGVPASQNPSITYVKEASAIYDVMVKCRRIKRAGVSKHQFILWSDPRLITDNVIVTEIVMFKLIVTHF